MNLDAVMIWRLAPARGAAIACDICGAQTMVYDEVVWLTESGPTAPRPGPS